MKIFKGVWVFAVVLCFASSFSFAGDLSRSGPCQADIAKFCKKVKPGRERLLRCMRVYDKHLSDSCKAHITVVKENNAVFVKVCKKNIRQYCGDVKAGRGDVYRCLQRHKDKLDARCADRVRQQYPSHRIGGWGHSKDVGPACPSCRPPGRE